MNLINLIVCIGLQGVFLSAVRMDSKNFELRSLDVFLGMASKPSLLFLNFSSQAIGITGFIPLHGIRYEGTQKRKASLQIRNCYSFSRDSNLCRASSEVTCNRPGVVLGWRRAWASRSLSFGSHKLKSCTQKRMHTKKPANGL